MTESYESPTQDSGQPLLPPPAPCPARLPFEDPETHPELWTRLLQTLRLAFSRPWAFFEAIPASEGLGSPWRFQMLCLIPTVAMGALGLGLLALAGGLAAVSGALNRHGAALAGGMLIGALVLILLLAPLAIFLAMAISGAITHFFLWIWGGTRQRVGLEQTIRAEGYVSGVSALLMLPLQLLGLIPFVGLVFSFCSFLLTLAIVVVKGMGLARVHRTDTWRGVCAALSPMILACCCIFLGIAAAIGIPALRR